MNRPVVGSLRGQMLLTLVGVLVLLVASASYILYSTVQIQATVTASLDRQRTLHAVQVEVADFHRVLLDYLSTKSSNALSALLIEAQKISALVPVDNRPSFDPVKQSEKEVYSLVGVYLADAGRAIEAKRAMNVDGYTKIFAEMQRILDTTDEEIAAISSTRFGHQLSDYEEFLALSRDVQFWNLLFILFISLASLLLIVQAVETINGPLVHLSRAAKEVASGRFDGADVPTTSLSEIDRVVEAFNRMKHDIQTFVNEIQRQRVVEQGYLEERVKNLKMEEMLQRMELFTHQAQMNPHFLFNTLNTGIQLAIVENADRTSEYMGQLTRLFRHNLHGQSVVVKLGHEIEGLQSYFSILGVRFPKNLDCVLDCGDLDLDRYEVPSYLLQPLVENCVVHGFKTPHRQNTIVVRVRLDGDVLVLSVADNGVGIPADKVEGLLRAATADESHSKVMGLENVIRRLHFFYPDDPQVVSITTAPGQGTDVVVRIDTRRPLCIPS